MAAHAPNSPALSGINRLTRYTAFMCSFLQHMRCRWYLYMMLFLIWSLAFIRVFVDPTPRIPVLFNITPSLPYKIAIIQYGEASFRRGDFVVFSFFGEAEKTYPGLKQQPFFKIIRGVAGDRITVKDRHVYVNGEEAGFAKTHSFDHRPLEPITEMRIPPGYFYVQGTHADSFDSRYQSSGLVRVDRIIGKVKPIF